MNTVLYSTATQFDVALVNEKGTLAVLVRGIELTKPIINLYRELQSGFGVDNAGWLLFLLHMNKKRTSAVVLDYSC